MQTDRFTKENDPRSCKSPVIDDINRQLLSIPGEHCPDDLPLADANGRQHPDHGVFISATKPTIVFGTICCEKRIPWLANDQHHEHLLKIWQDTSHWVVGRYVLMPDHLHFFAAPQPNAVDFDRWAKYIKSQFTKRNQDPKCVWQTDHWDTRIRCLEHYEEKSVYMLNNPVRAGLVTNSKEWKYQGVVHELRWD